jgi:hypothetical protein
MGGTNVGWATVRWKPIPTRWPFFYTEDGMDIYTLGRLALPGVVAIMAIAALLTLFAGVFTAVKTLMSLQRFFQQMENGKRPSVTINIITGRRASKPPMQERK